MLAVILCAVMIDRRAITLRNVAIAALIVLVVEPESLLTASFQMSFAATLALVAGYEALRDRADRKLSLASLADRGLAGRLWFSAHGLFLTSLIAALATTPFAIYHFQRAAPLALLANLAAMPVVGLLVMPAALFAVILMPLGLESAALIPMGWGIDWFVLVGEVTAEWSAGLGRHPRGTGGGAPSRRRRLPLAGALAGAMADGGSRPHARGSSHCASRPRIRMCWSMPSAARSLSAAPTTATASSIPRPIVSPPSTGSVPTPTRARDRRRLVCRRHLRRHRLCRRSGRRRARRRRFNAGRLR